MSDFCGFEGNARVEGKIKRPGRRPYSASAGLSRGFCWATAFRENALRRIFTIC